MSAVVTIEGFNYLLAAGFKQASQYPTVYIGLFTGTYQPVEGDTLATLLANVTEVTAYAGSTRRAVALGNPTNAGIDNLADVTEFEGNGAVVTVNGAFVATSSGKGATTGLLLGAMLFPSPETLKNGSKLQLPSGFQFANA